MKSFLFVFLLFLPQFLFASYLLDCPGKSHPILPERYDWIKMGEIIEPSSDHHPIELARVLHKVKKYSHFMAEKIESVYDVFQPIKSDIEWRPGISLQAEALGFPKMIDDCKVLPIIARIEGRLIGSSDDVSRMNEFDKILFKILRHTDLRADDLRYTLTEREWPSTTPKEKLKVLSSITFGGYEIYGCYFDSNGQPSGCRQRGKGTDNTRKIEFWPSGLLKLYELREGHFSLNLVQPSPKVFCKSSLFNKYTLYREDGSLQVCGNALYDLHGKGLVTPSPSVIHEKPTPIQIGDQVLFPVQEMLLNSEQKPILVHLERAPTKIPASMKNYHFYPEDRRNQEYLSTELYPDGSIKSGLFQKEQFSNIEYFEFDPRGKVTRKLSDSSKNYKAVAELVMNPSSTRELKFDLSRSSRTVVEANFLALSPGCPKPVFQPNSPFVFILQPHCSVYVKTIFYRGN